MAYNSSYNPDALPAHAEPEQVAQMIGSLQVGGKPASASAPQKPLPSRPPVQTFLGGGVPPRVPVSSAPPQHNPYSSPAPRPDLQATQSYNGRPTIPPNQHPPSGQQKPHPLHPSPPPQNYGFGPPPSQPNRNRPPPSSRPPQSPAPPPLAVPSDDPQQLFPLFRAANSSHSGSLTEHELGSALVNGDYTSFHPRTVKMMIRMFDRNGNGIITFEEFVSLWRYLAAWRELFDRFDEDHSGRISLSEFENALVAFGYRLSPKFISVLFSIFESKTRQLNAPPRSPHRDGMSFDLFVQACISLKRMTDVFKRYDDDRDGYITVSFEEFLTEILQLQD
ncbi:EF-hand [Penicillium odoratum]|uniref:EF-hand n=1 Tax=Penicillium odoratum TaxID=1167516 RepID=UPI0025473DA8|nr:EF-hand [Penicillium odoratum]KAJ5769319.1 EF-hand [Penicillium odoratum]